MGHTVINLSDISLTESQVLALEKGLTFCPTPGPPNNAKIWTDFKEFHRRLCLKFHFYNDNQQFDHLSDQEIELINFMAENLEEETSPYQKNIESLLIKALGNLIQYTNLLKFSKDLSKLAFLMVNLNMSGNQT